MERPLVVQLSERQLAAYNVADLDAFCACYHPEMIVLDADGGVVRRGAAEFRAAYAAMFEAHRDVRAEVTERLVLGEHMVEREAWSRVRRDTGERSEGVVLVRFTERDGLLAVVEFLRAR